MLNTINVIEKVDDALSLRSFEDNAKGNKEAEELFKAIAKENGKTEEEIEIALEDGCYTDGDYELFLTHSSPLNV